MDTVNTELIRGHVDTIILNSLEERDRYGYEILDIISDLSEGRYEIKQPTLYSCLKRLEKQGFISSYFGDETQGGRRRYYQLTEKGRATLEQDQREWEFSRTIINRLLSDKEIDLKTVEAPFDPSELRPLTRRVKAYDAPGEVLLPEERDKEIFLTNATAAAVEAVPVKDEEAPKELSVPEKSDSVAAAPAVSPTVDANVPNRATDYETLRKQDAASKFLKIGDYAERKILIPEDDKITAVKYKSEEELRREAELKRIPTEENLYAQGILYAQPAPADREEETARPVNVEKRAYSEESIQAQNILYSAAPMPNTVQSGADMKQDIPVRAANASKTTPPAKSEPEINYKEALSAVYENAERAQAKAEIYDNNPDPSLGHAMLFGDLRQRLMDEGYKLKSYNKANSSNYYYMKFVYSNKLLKNTGFLCYLMIAIVAAILTILIRTGSMSIGYEVPLLVAALGLIVPVTTTLVWASNPTKRIKASYNAGASITYSFIAFMGISIVSLVVCLLADVDFNTGVPYVPVMIAALIPATALVYWVLYRSGNYHLK